ncbi:MAG TPA: tRNA lysidine(34) synthetase TilS [Rhizobiaceae bacterium]|nr:tRNA lysidine(34) synthetase TilS [Rhizobiaceae bacterium]
MLSSRPDLDPVRLFSPIDFASRKAVLVAVSGGGDSTALLLLLKSFLDRRHPDVKLVAVTVDHGLRPESAAEALEVSRLCAIRGISHRGLRWDGEKPRTGLSAAGREARYRLLANAARDAATDIVFVGHTEDDQVETVSMRGTRSEGRGTAAIAPATLHDSVWYVRPLLDVSRENLRHFLRDETIRWIEDPSNDNPAYERVRIRKSIAEAGEGERARLAALAREAARKRAADGETAAMLIERCAALAAPGLVRLAPEFAEESDGAVYALRILLATVGGQEQLPDLGRTEALFRKLQPGLRATLARAVIDVRKSGVYLRREARGLPDVRRAGAGDIWDGRFQLEQAADGMTVAAFGTRSPRQVELPGSSIPHSLVGAALACQPALLSASGKPFLADRTEALFNPIVSPWARLLPYFDIAPARAIASLIGAKPFPTPPFASHIAGEA